MKQWLQSERIWKRLVYCSSTMATDIYVENDGKEVATEHDKLTP